MVYRLLANFQETTREFMGRYGIGMKLKAILALVTVCACHFCSMTVAYADQPANVHLLSDTDKTLTAWQHKIFAGRTAYDLLQEGGKVLLRAQSRGTASGLYREREVDLEEYPYLNWRWKIDERLAGVDESTKSGDDYSARIYVIVKDGLLFWKTRAICYVWSSTMQKGSVWDNAYAGESVKMIAVRSRDDAVKTWYRERRNVRSDFARLYGDEIDKIDSIAVMVDTDNSDQEATSYYADINFSAR